MRKDRRNGISMFLRNSARFLTKLRWALLWLGTILLSCFGVALALEPAPLSAPAPEPPQGMPSLSGYQINWTHLSVDTVNWPGFRGYVSFVGQNTPGRVGQFLYAGPPGTSHSNIIYSSCPYLFSAVSKTYTQYGTCNPVPDSPGGAHVLSMTYTNPAVLTIDNPFPNVASAPLVMESASITNCAGFNGPQTTISSTSTTITISFDASACSAYVGSSGYLLNQGCTGTSTIPANQHPGQMSIDTLRNRAYLIGGVNDQTCAGANSDKDIWYMPLDQSIPTNWVKVGSQAAGFAGEQVPAGRVYDPDDDVTFIFGNAYGFPNHGAYCESNVPLQAKQQAAGCETSLHVYNPGAVNTFSAKGTGGVDCNTFPYDSCPLGVDYPNMVYDTVHHKVLMWGGGSTNTTTFYNDTWAYDPPTRTWTKMCGAGCVNPTNYANGATTGQPATVFNATTGTGLMFYHQAYGPGAPADFAYDWAVDKWYTVTTTGGGPGQGRSSCVSSPTANCEVYIGLDSSAGTHGTMSTWGNDGSLISDVWEGAITVLGSSSATVTSGIQSSGVTIH